MLPPEFGYEYPHSARSCNLSPCNVRNTPSVTVISPRELGSYFTAALMLSYTIRQLSVHQKSGYSSSSSFLEYAPIIAQCFPFVNRYFQFFSEISLGRHPRCSTNSLINRKNGTARAAFPTIGSLHLYVRADDIRPYCSLLSAFYSLISALSFLLSALYFLLSTFCSLLSTF